LLVNEHKIRCALFNHQYVVFTADHMLGYQLGDF